MLTVSLAGAASGSVTGNAPGLVCPTSCTAMVDHGTAVTLTPAAAPGAIFAGWSGACSGTGACTVTVDADRTVTARFEPARQRLSVAFNGNGRVTSKPAGLDCRRDCSRQLAYGATVTLTPAADRGWRFLGWRGACAGAKGACTLSMTQPRSTTAVFVRAGGAVLAPAGARQFIETASAKPRQGATPVGEGGRGRRRIRAGAAPAPSQTGVGVPSRRLASAAARATSVPRRATPSSSRRYSGTQMLIAATGRAWAPTTAVPTPPTSWRYAPRLMA